MSKEKGKSLLNEIMFAAMAESQRDVYKSQRCLDFVDLCLFSLAFSQSVQDEINNYRSVITIPHYMPTREVYEFLFLFTITHNSLTSVNITFDLKYHYNISKLHYIIY